MKDTALSKKIFCDRAKKYFLNSEIGEANEHRSIVYDLLNTSLLFGFQNEVKNMLNRNHFYPKQTWKENVWKRGWDVEDKYWRI